MNKRIKSFVIPAGYPFKEAVESQGKRLKDTTYTVTVERVTVSQRITYTDTLYAKLFQNRELLDELSPSACKLLIHICCRLQYEDVMIKLVPEDVALSRPTFYKALFELVTQNIIRKVARKREMYWVNISLVVVGDPHKTIGSG